MRRLNAAGLLLYNNVKISEPLTLETATSEWSQFNYHREVTQSDLFHQGALTTQPFCSASVIDFK